LWAGYGAVALATRRATSRFARVAIAGGLAVAALPALLNWRVMDRRREPDASTAALVADALLAGVPPNGVLVVWGDNDTYPLWEAQQARAARRDVTVVTSPLLGVDWYRDELRRRWSIDAGPLASEATMVLRVVAATAARGRPVAIAMTVPAAVRARTGREWSACGLAWTEPGVACSIASANALDRLIATHPVGRFTENTVRSMLETARCARIAARPAGDSAAGDSLARACNAR
jgi:hypothetical protein